jgi:parallel beta-helix repeat protein
LFTTHENQIEKNLKSSSFWNLTGSPIFIDDSNPNYNWSKTAADNDWCRGNGTLQNPYLIENVTIDSQDSGSCIEIKNSARYFIIRNCTLYRSGSVLDADGGIKLESVNNGRLINNNCSFNGNGIFLSFSSNNNLSGNTVNNNTNHGIKLVQCSYLNVLGNKANYNYDGINLFSAGPNIISGNIVNNNFGNGLYSESGGIYTISGNTACNNTDSGIRIYRGNYHNITGNIIDNNKISGINLYSSGWCTVSGNNVTNNTDGIYLKGSHTISGVHEISENNISYNNGYGLYLLDTNGNNISNNIIDNNEIGLYLENSNNTDILRNNIINNTYIGLYLVLSNDNNIFNNVVCGNTIDKHEVDCERNEFENNKCIDEPPENRIPFELVIMIVIIIILIMISSGIVFFKSRSSRREKISKNKLSSHKLKKELRKTEAEVSVEKESHACVVHRGKIVGAVYICPKCETYYCMKCANVLKKKGETCWACNNKIDL